MRVEHAPLEPHPATPPKAGQIMRGVSIVHLLDAYDLTLLKMLYRLAARGAEAEGDASLAAELSMDRVALEFRLRQRGRHA